MPAKDHELKDEPIETPEGDEDVETGNEANDTDPGADGQDDDTQMRRRRRMPYTGVTPPAY